MQATNGNGVFVADLAAERAWLSEGGCGVLRLASGRVRRRAGSRDTDNAPVAKPDGFCGGATAATTSRLLRQSDRCRPEMSIVSMKARGTGGSSPSSFAGSICPSATAGLPQASRPFRGKRLDLGRHAPCARCRDRSTAPHSERSVPHRAGAKREWSRPAPSRDWSVRLAPCENCGDRPDCFARPMHGSLPY